LTEVRLPGPRDDAGSAYRKLKQRASGYAIVGVAAVVVRGPDRKIAEARIGITGVSDVAYRATAVEKALIGSDGSAKAIAAAAAHATDGRTVNGDIHADTEYRTAMAVVYTRRAIEGALARLDE
ncbi:MAG: xanthine dehydrogenase family protein subunit M, partial [Chloroflexota bacterium]|nr:xanthine dehydrogenase family protein subunit M [Chloroflexota bacterium]